MQLNFKKRIAISGTLLTLFVLTLTFPVLAAEGEASGFGLLSLLPPLLAILLCIVTKQVIPSLFLGAWVAGIMLAGGNPVMGFGKAVEFIWNSLGDPWGARIALTSLTMGGIIGVIQVGGGIEAVVNWITRFIKTARSAMLTTELAGFVIFFEDYVNTLVVGTTMGPITEDYRISREKLSYIVDSTAAPIACIAGISSWIAYMVGQIGTQFDQLDISISAYGAYLQSIPYIFYNIIALILVSVVVLSQRDMGNMLEAERRARNTGKLIRDGAHPLIKKEAKELQPDEGCPRRLINFIFPIVTLVGLIVFLLAGTGDWPEVSFFTAITQGSSSHALIWGSFGTAFITIVIYWLQGLADLETLFNGFMEGMRSIFFGTLILIFAWGIGNAIGEVGTAEFLVGITQGILSPAIIPLITFIVGAMVSFSTGTAYGTIGILTPIVIPLIHQTSLNSGLGATAFMFPAIGAIFAGAVWGDHSSPISDTTVMSSMFSGSDHMDHVNTQIPYALVAAIGAIVAYLGVALGLPALINIMLGGIITIAIFWFRSEPIGV